jgi:cyclase
MRNVRLIARLDIKGKNLIKGIRLEGLRVLGNPYEFAKKYFDEGIDEILYMDTVASLYNRNSLNNIVAETSKNIFIPITVGGGIRSIEDATQALKSGADKIAINTAAVNNPGLVKELCNRFGSSTIVISIEAKKLNNAKWEVYTNNGREATGLDVINWAAQCEKLGAGEILLTSVDQEGTGQGFDYNLIDQVSKKTNIPVIASGGMGSLNDFLKVVTESNCEAVAIADILHYKKKNIDEIKNFAKKNSITVRV